MLDWQVTEILAGCLFTALFLALVLIATQCLASCFDNWRTSRYLTAVELTPPAVMTSILKAKTWSRALAGRLRGRDTKAIGQAQEDHEWIRFSWRKQRWRWHLEGRCEFLGELLAPPLDRSLLHSLPNIFIQGKTQNHLSYPSRTCYYDLCTFFCALTSLPWANWSKVHSRARTGLQHYFFHSC